MTPISEHRELWEHFQHSPLSGRVEDKMKSVYGVPNKSQGTTSIWKLPWDDRYDNKQTDRDCIEFHFHCSRSMGTQLYVGYPSHEIEENKADIVKFISQIEIVLGL